MSICEPGSASTAPPRPGSGRARFACFARGPDQALDQFELAVVADGGDAPGDGDIFAAVGRASHQVTMSVEVGTSTGCPRVADMSRGMTSRSI